jgi:hypothetical protein
MTPVSPEACPACLETDETSDDIRGQGWKVNSSLMSCKVAMAARLTIHIFAWHLPRVEDDRTSCRRV